MIIADDTRASVSLGRIIDWRVFHHFCLTYDGPSRGGESTLAFYFDGDHQWQETLSLDTKIEDGTGMSLGMSQMYSDSLSAALDEVYVYASALDASDIEVLYGSVSAAPTVTPVPTSHLFEGSLVAYYPFVDGTTQDAHHSWNGTPESMTATEGRDGGSAIVLDAERRDLRHAAPRRRRRTCSATPTGLCVCGRVSTSGKVGACSTTAATVRR